MGYLDWYEDCIKRDKNTCQDCGYAGPLTRVVHHIDGSRSLGVKNLNNNLDNLVVLCRPCHARRHGLTSKKEDIIEMRASGMTYREIGEKLGLSRQRIYQLCFDKLVLDTM